MFDESEMVLSAVAGENSAAVLDDDYALIEHQLEKQRQLENQKKRKDRLTGEAFIAHQVQNAGAPQGKSYFLLNCFFALSRLPSLIQQILHLSSSKASNKSKSTVKRRNRMTATARTVKRVARQPSLRLARQMSLMRIWRVSPTDYSKIIASRQLPTRHRL